MEAISSDSDSRRIKVLLALRSKFGDSLEGDWIACWRGQLIESGPWNRLATLTQNDSVLSNFEPFCSIC